MLIQIITTVYIINLDGVKKNRCWVILVFIHIINIYQRLLWIYIYVLITWCYRTILNKNRQSWRSVKPSNNYSQWPIVNSRWIVRRATIDHRPTIGKQTLCMPSVCRHLRTSIPGICYLLLKKWMWGWLIIRCKINFNYFNYITYVCILFRSANLTIILSPPNLIKFFKYPTIAKLFT